MSALLGAELNSALKDLFDKRISIVILATVDQDNHPHTAPFNYLVAHGLKHLRVAVSRNHQTYRNIMENGKVALAVLDEGDIAVSIKGTGRLLLENMESDYNMSIIDIEIDEIKKDNSNSYFVTQGVRIRHKNEPVLLSSRKIFQELSRMD